jgi:hypothetical protein
MEPELSGRLCGFVGPDGSASIPGSTYYSPLTEFGLQDISDNTSIEYVACESFLQMLSPYLPFLLAYCFTILISRRQILNSSPFFFMAFDLPHPF